jgi:uncharacterized protein YdbL (DUF1318 family)
VANVIVSALATWNGKALKKAQQDVNVFEKRIKNFARTFGYAFSATAVVAFSKKAVKAFAEDEAAAKSLQLQLENTGNAFAVAEVEQYIKSLEKTYAILNDLRGPFQTFLNLTRSVALSQRTLEAALNISAGTGQSLDTVVGALAAGIRGQTRALVGLNTGVDANIIKSGDMNKIMAELEKKFSGQASARLDTYAGKMDTLRKSSDEATKAIGAGLVDALTILSKDQSIENLANNFENLGENIAFAITEMAKLVKGFNDLVNNPSFKAGLLALAIASKSPKAVVAAFTIVGGSAVAGLATKDLSGQKNRNIGGYSGIPDLRTTQNIIKARKEEYKIISKKNEIENKNLEELKKKFDLERISLTAALNNATDEETKLRLKSQLAIIDGDEAMAQKLLAELNAAEALKKLAEQAAAAGKSITEFALIQVRSLINRINAQIESINRTFGLSTPTGTLSGGSNPIVGTTGGGIFDPGFFRQGENRDLIITVETQGTGDRFAQLIAESLQVAQKSGVSYGIAGGL